MTYLAINNFATNKDTLRACKRILVSTCLRFSLFVFYACVGAIGACSSIEPERSNDSAIRSDTKPFRLQATLDSEATTFCEDEDTFCQAFGDGEKNAGVLIYNANLFEGANNQEKAAQIGDLTLTGLRVALLQGSTYTNGKRALVAAVQLPLDYEKAGNCRGYDGADGSRYRNRDGENIRYDLRVSVYDRVAFSADTLPELCVNEGDGYRLSRILLGRMHPSSTKRANQNADESVLLSTLLYRRGFVPGLRENTKDISIANQSETFPSTYYETKLQNVSGTTEALRAIERGEQEVFHLVGNTATWTDRKRTKIEDGTGGSYMEEDPNNQRADSPDSTSVTILPIQGVVADDTGFDFNREVSVEGVCAQEPLCALSYLIRELILAHESVLN